MTAPTGVRRGLRGRQARSSDVSSPHGSCSGSWANRRILSPGVTWAWNPIRRFASVGIGCDVAHVAQLVGSRSPGASAAAIGQGQHPGPERVTGRPDATPAAVPGRVRGEGQDVGPATSVTCTKSRWPPSSNTKGIGACGQSAAEQAGYAGVGGVARHAGPVDCQGNSQRRDRHVVLKLEQQAQVLPGGAFVAAYIAAGVDRRRLLHQTGSESRPHNGQWRFEATGVEIGDGSRPVVLDRASRALVGAPLRTRPSTTTAPADSRQPIRCTPSASRRCPSR